MMHAEKERDAGREREGGRQGGRKQSREKERERERERERGKERRVRIGIAEMNLKIRFVRGTWTGGRVWMDNRWVDCTRYVKQSTPGEMDSRSWVEGVSDCSMDHDGD
jgi:hypothetical protein